MGAATGISFAWSRWTRRRDQAILGRRCRRRRRGRPSGGWWRGCSGWAGARPTLGGGGRAGRAAGGGGVEADGVERGRPEGAAEGRAEEDRAGLGVAFADDDAAGVDRGAAQHGHARASGVVATTPRPKPARRIR